MMTFESDVLSELVHERKLSIVGGVYNLHTGKVEFMNGRESDNSHDVKAERNNSAPVNNAPMKATPVSTSHSKALVAPTSHQKAPAPVAKPTPAPVKKAPSSHSKETSHGSHDDETSSLSQPQMYIELPVRTEVAFTALPFIDKLRAAYENNYEVTLRTSALLRDSKDRCLTIDCRSLPAGEIVTLDSPHMLSVMGRPSIRVRYGKQSFYIPAEEKNFAFSEVSPEPSKPLISQVLTAPTKLMSAFSQAAKR